MSGPVLTSVQGYQDRTVLGAVYPTESVTRVVSVDTRFRENPRITNPSDCTIRLPRVYKNVTSIRLSSVEIPNNWYDFTKNFENTSFKVNGKACVLPDGNYTAETLSTAISTTILNVTGLQINVVFDVVTGKCCLESADDPVAPFTIDFTPVSICACCSTPYTPSCDNDAGIPCSCGGCIRAPAANRLFDTGLGYYLGFTNTLYQGYCRYTSESITNVVGPTYVLLSLDKYNAMDHLSFNNTSLSAFAKVIVGVEKNAMIYDSGLNTISNRVQFPEPENIATFKIKLTDCYGRVLPIFGNMSLTLELQEVVSSKLYTAYKDNLVSRRP